MPGLGRHELMATPEIVADYACHTGENPLWHAAEQRLYWTDIPAGRLFRFDSATGEHAQVYEGRPVGGFTVQADGSLLLFMDRGTVAIWRDGQIVRTIIDEIADERDSRFNDVIADTEGRVFCGTMSVKDAAGNILRYGRLYRLDRNGTLVKLLDGIGTSNGLGFTPERRQLYYTDTRARTIWLFDYDSATGAIGNQRVFVRTPDAPEEGRPDGLTVDAAGDVWSARWDGSCVVRYSPDGVERERIAVPTKKVSCPAFGGPQLDELYLTTAGGDDRTSNGVSAGALYRVLTSARGVPEFFSRVGL